MKRSDTTRRQIVDYVRQQICLHGITRLTMDDIARGMHISKRTLYQFFPQKTCLVRLCLSDIACQARENLPDGQLKTAAACVRSLFRTIDGYITLLHTFGSTLLDDIVPDAEYRSFVEWEKAFWHRQVLEAFDRCRASGCLLPCVEPEIVASDLLEAFFQQCRQGAPFPTQRLMGHIVLRGFFRVKQIGYIDKHLAVDSLPA